MRIATFSRMSRAQKYSFRNVMKVFFSPSQQIRGSIVVSISACHAEDPGSIPGRGVFPQRSWTLIMEL
jgi:hypothetical protein